MEDKYESEYEKDQKIDEHNLNHEWARQSSLYMKWAKHAALAKEEKFLADENLKTTRSDAKKDIERLRAEINLDVLADPVIYGFEKKPTVDAIMAIILQDENYKGLEEKNAEEIETAVKRVADAIYNDELLEGARMAMNHKKTSLEYYVQLHFSGYNADPKERPTVDIAKVQKEGLSKSKRLVRRRKAE